MRRPGNPWASPGFLRLSPPGFLPAEIAAQQYGAPARVLRQSPGSAGGAEALLVTLVICGVLAMVVVAIAAGFIYSRFEGSKANVLAFALGGMGLAVGLVVAFAMASPS